MIDYVLILLGLGDLAGVAHFLAHHRDGLTGATVTLLAWVAHRVRRRFTNTGQRVAGMAPLKPLAERRAA